MGGQNVFIYQSAPLSFSRRSHHRTQVLRSLKGKEEQRKEGKNQAVIK